MAERFLQLDVSKLMFSLVYLKIDDKDPRFSGLFSANGELAMRAFYFDELRDVVKEAVFQTLEPEEWEEQKRPEFEVECCSEVDQKDAERFKVFDTIENKAYPETGPDSIFKKVD